MINYLDFTSFAESFADEWEIIVTQFPTAIWETIYAVFVSTLIAMLIGIPLGIILVTGDENGIAPLPKWLISILNLVINLLRSVPFLILIIVLIPFTRMVVGTIVGTTASIVPLVVATAPYVARITEASIREVDSNIIEMAQSMGATPIQIVLKVLIPESVPSLISNLTITLTNVLGYTATTGILGGGGLGKIAINYGYYRYRYLIMIAAVIVLIIMVQIIQSVGTYIAN